MFWWFERNGQHLRLEVLELRPGAYELRLIDPNGEERIETFNDARDLADRQEEVHQILGQQGWTGPHGWLI